MTFQNKNLTKAEKKALCIIACELVLGKNFCTKEELSFRMNLNMEATGMIIKSLTEKGQIDFNGRLYLNFGDEKITSLIGASSSLSSEALEYVDGLIDYVFELRSEKVEAIKH